MTVGTGKETGTVESLSSAAVIESFSIEVEAGTGGESLGTFGKAPAAPGCPVELLGNGGACPRALKRLKAISFQIHRKLLRLTEGYYDVELVQRKQDMRELPAAQET